MSNNATVDDLGKICIEPTPPMDTGDVNSRRGLSALPGQYVRCLDQSVAPSGLYASRSRGAFTGGWNSRDTRGRISFQTDWTYL
jgi:hypothetical protein